MSGDLKDTTGKPPLHLVPLRALDNAAWVMQFGDAKYAPFNWLAAVDEGDAGVRKYVAAALRHLGALWEDLDALDSESQRPHLAHALTSLLFASEIRRRQRASEPATTLPSDLVGKRVVRFDGRDVAEGPPWAPGDGFGETQYWGAQAKPDVDWTILEARDGWARCRFFDDLWFPVDAIAEVSE